MSISSTSTQHERKSGYRIEDETDIGEDAHIGEGEDYKAIEHLNMADAKKRKHGEILVASSWAGNIRRRLSEIEEVALEELKAEKHKQINVAHNRADNIRWALIEVEDWGLAIREGLLPDGTPLQFSKYFITHLGGAVEKAEAAMALAKIALRATLNISYLGPLSQTSLDLVGVPFSNLMATHATITKELQKLEKRIKMWREIAKNRGVPVKEKGSSFNVEDDPMANPADPYFNASEEVRAILGHEIEQTIDTATTIDGKSIDGKAILDRYYNYLNQYRDNFYAAVGTPDDKKYRPNSKEVQDKLQERRVKRLQAAKEERAKRKAQRELTEQRKARSELREDIVRKAKLDRKDFEDRKRKRAEGATEDLRLGFYKSPPDSPEVRDGESDPKRPRFIPPVVVTPPTRLGLKTPPVDETRSEPPTPVKKGTIPTSMPTPPPTPPTPTPVRTETKRVRPSWPVKHDIPIRPRKQTPPPMPEWVKKLVSGVNKG